MKLQLLLVLAVAALVPSLSESRIFSKCELKSIFEKSISLHGKTNKHKEEYLAAIICHLNETSGLDSNLVTIEGIRVPRTTATPSTLEPTNETEGPKESTTTPTASTPTATTATPTTAASADVSTSGPASPFSSTLSGMKQRRRRSSKNNKNTDTHKSRNPKESSEEMLFDVETGCDTQEIEEDDNCMNRRNRGCAESSEEDHQTTDWSLGKYGIFQLTDGHFCDSGYRWSRNVCKTNCSAFTDDDIQDDIQCFMHSKYLGCFLEKISDLCWVQPEVYFNECS